MAVLFDPLAENVVVRPMAPFDCKNAGELISLRPSLLRKRLVFMLIAGKEGKSSTLWVLGRKARMAEAISRSNLSAGRTGGWRSMYDLRTLGKGWECGAMVEENRK